MMFFCQRVIFRFHLSFEGRNTFMQDCLLEAAAFWTQIRSAFCLDIPSLQHITQVVMIKHGKKVV